MSSNLNTTTQFTVLFTAQKFKKNKTWQDGRIVYYSFNRKIILIDEKGYNIDKKFSKTGIPEVGDEIKFNFHLVTVELLDNQTSQTNATTNLQVTPILSTPQITNTDRQINPDILQSNISKLNIDQQPIRRRFRKMNIGLSQSHMASHNVFSSTNTNILMHNNNNNNSNNNNNNSNNNNNTYTDCEQLNNQVQPTVFNQYNNFNQQINSTGILSTNSSIQKSKEKCIKVPNVIEIGAIDTPITDTSSTFKNSSELSSNFLTNNVIVKSNDEQLAFDEFQTNTTPPNTSTSNTVNETHDVHMNSIQQEEQQIGVKRTTKDTNINIQKRVRIGLSKNSSKSLHSKSAIDVSLSANETIAAEDQALPSTSITLKENNLPPSSSSSRSLVSVTTSTAPSAFVPGSLVNSHNDEATSNTLLSNKSAPSKHFKIPYANGVSTPLVLFFPTLEKAMTVIKTRKLPKRTKIIPTKFKSVVEYKEIFKKAIHEHLQLMLLNNAMHYFINSEKATTNNMERFFRSKGLSFYTGCRLKNNSYYTHEDVFNLSVQNRENHNKYSKDDIWVISTSLSFDSSQTFLGRSTFYGPSSDGCIEFKCITPRDYRVASKFPTNQPSLFALRTISAGSEFMMLDTLEDMLDQLPVLPNILNDGKRSKRNNQPELHNVSMNGMNQLAVIRLTESDCINIPEKLNETAQQYKLNEDQANALYCMAKSVIIAPGWNEDTSNPITLVHGVFGSGKSFLAAVMIIFLRELIDTVNDKREPEDQISFKIMITCFTNVAVDRILSVLVKLGFDNFVRIGSLKRIAKNLLPYTVRAKITGNEELKELEHMLDDPNNTEEEIENISSAIQRFRKCENILEVHKADVVGTTCNASSFDIFNDTVFPFVLMDECSQIMEPMTIVPLARFKCSRMVLIGDPLQLPPTIATQSDDDKIGQGLDKTLFSRLIEMGIQSIMLRSQYRCHPNISSISNKLFYENKLLNGHVVETRQPLVTGLSPLIFVDVIGNDQKSIGNSFWNRDEIAIVAHTIQELSNLGVDSSSIGIISLYKEQVDKIQLYLGNNTSNQNNISNIQISTVDAFQGAEKEIIILSTVRTLVVDSLINLLESM
ncbi:unnamed protein product [Cunninghamella echinulata]